MSCCYLHRGDMGGMGGMEERSTTKLKLRSMGVGTWI